MVIEITAYRLLAPVYGSSSLTWTALIGVILIAFSAGGWLGGWLAERKPEFTLIGWLLSGTAVMTMLVPLAFAVAVPVIGYQGAVASPLVVASILFIIPGVLLGAVSPASVRLLSLLGNDAHVGRAAGTISMLGSLGSFVGTLLAGFYLLTNFGVKSIFIGTGLVLVSLASVAFSLARSQSGTHLPAWLAAAVGLIFGSATQAWKREGVIYEQESIYQHVQVLEEGDKDSKVRFLHLNSVRNGGARVSDGAISVGYQKFWRLPLMRPGFDVQRALFIGAGAFAMPQHLSRQFPAAQIEVNEIDPAVIDVGRKFFRLDEFPRVLTHEGDARRWLRQDQGQKFDLIFGDAYASTQIPPHLGTREFFQLVHDRLTPQGVYAMNVITAVNGPEAEVLAGLMSTVRDVFPHLELFALKDDLSMVQNVIMLATKEPWTPLFTSPAEGDADLTRHYVPHVRWPTLGPVFTDDWNPMDGIVAKVQRSNNRPQAK